MLSLSGSVARRPNKWTLYCREIQWQEGCLQSIYFIQYLTTQYRQFRSPDVRERLRTSHVASYSTTNQWVGDRSDQLLDPYDATHTNHETCHSYVSAVHAQCSRHLSQVWSESKGDFYWRVAWRDWKYGVPEWSQIPRTGWTVIGVGSQIGWTPFHSEVATD